MLPHRLASCSRHTERSSPWCSLWAGCYVIYLPCFCLLIQFQSFDFCGKLTTESTQELAKRNVPVSALLCRAEKGDKGSLAIARIALVVANLASWLAFFFGSGCDSAKCSNTLCLLPGNKPLQVCVLTVIIRSCSPAGPVGSGRESGNSAGMKAALISKGGSSRAGWKHVGCTLRSDTASAAAACAGCDLGCRKKAGCGLVHPTHLQSTIKIAWELLCLQMRRYS